MSKIVGPPMPKSTLKKPGTPRPGTRAFKGTFFVVISDDVWEEDDAETLVEDVTREAVIDFLQDAVCLDVDTEECGNPVGWAAIELHYDTLTEMTPEEMGWYYGA